MKRLLIPAVLALLGLAAGGGAALALRPVAPAVAPAPHDPTTATAGHSAGGHDTGAGESGSGNAPEYARLSNQFVVPVLDQGRVTAMVILSLSIEVTAGSTPKVYEREPKLRDAFLQVLFDHSNAGGFAGTFTDGSNLILLRRALREAAAGILGDMVSDVLIVEIVRQDA